jgi:CRISPR-associated endoribonuclease Cas6
METELLSLVITLRPLATPAAERPLPRWWGRAAHALLLQVVQDYSPELAAALHDGSERRPFTVSTLQGPALGKGLYPEQDYRLRFTALTGPVSAALLAAVQGQGRLATGATVELDYVPFQVAGAAWNEDEQPWAGATTYASLSAGCLLPAAVPDRQIPFQFTSPVVFRSEGKSQPFPLARLVFHGLLERWNAFAPLALPEDLRRYVDECLLVDRFELSSRAVPLKETGLRVGSVGMVAYRATNNDRYWLGLLHTLAEYTRFAGVGAGTSLGLGQCRKAAG